MTIASNIRRAGPFATNGVDTVFPFAFKVFKAEDVVVSTKGGGVVTTLQNGVDFTVSLNADQESAPGGTITMTLAPDDVVLTILSDAAIEQPTEFTNQGGFYPNVLNTALDRLTIFDQQIDEKLGRALKVRAGETPPAVGEISDGQVLGLVGGQLAGVTNDPAAAEDAAVRSETALATILPLQEAVADDAQQVSEDKAAAQAARDNALTAESGAEAARDGAIAARDAAQSVRNIYASTAAALGRGVQGYSALVGGATGTDGTFPLVVTGGTAAIAATGYFVVEGGAVTQIVIDTPGHYTVDPTGFDFSASAGLAGASAVPTVAVNEGVGSYFATPSASDTGSSDLYVVEAGPVATLVDTLPATSFVNGVATSLNEWIEQAPSIVVDSVIGSGSGGVIANTNYKYAEIELPLPRPAGFAVRVSTTLTNAPFAVGNFYSETIPAGDGSDFIEAQIIPVAQTTYPDQLLTIPTGARLLRVNCIKAYPDPIIDFFLFADDVGLRIASAELANAATQADHDALATTVGDVWNAVTLPAPVVDKYIARNDGTEFANTSYSYWLVPRPEGEKWRVTSTIQGGATCLAVFFGEGGLADPLGFQDPQGTSVATTYTNVELVMPAACRYVAFSTRDIPPVVEKYGNAGSIVDRLAGLEAGSGLTFTGPITVIGDSNSTAGAAGFGDELATQFPERLVYQQGCGSQTFRSHMLPRLGIIENPILTIGGGASLSWDGTETQITLTYDQLLRSSEDVTQRVTLHGILCALRSNKTTTNIYTIEALEPMGANITINAGDVPKVVSGVIFGNGADPMGAPSMAELFNRNTTVVMFGAPSTNERSSYGITAELADNIQTFIEWVTARCRALVMIGPVGAMSDVNGSGQTGAPATEALEYDILRFYRWANNYLRDAAPYYVDALQNEIDTGGTQTVTSLGVDFEVMTLVAAPDGRHRTTARQLALAQHTAGLMEGWGL